MLIVNIPFVGVSRIPGPELGFNMFYKDYYIERNYYFPDDQLLIMKSVNSRKAEQKAIDRINNTIESGCDLLFFGGNHATTAYIYEEILYKKDIPIIILTHIMTREIKLILIITGISSIILRNMYLNDAFWIQKSE